MRRLLASAIVFVLVGAVAVGFGLRDLWQAEAAVTNLPPRVVFTPAVCDGGLSARVNVTNPAGNGRDLRIGFNSLPPSPVEPGGSYGYELDRGQVQVMVDGRPFGDLFVYQPPSCLLLP